MTTLGPNQAGPAGEDFGVDYLYEDTVGTSNPGSGKLGLDNADHSLATTLVLSETDANAVNVAGWLGTFDDSTSTTKGQLFVRKAADQTVYRIFNVTAATDSGTFWTLTVSLAEQNGTLTEDDPLKIAFLPKGDKGDTGATGAAGSDGTNGSDGRDAGWNYKFNSATSGDPGSGKILFNNATLASATEIRVYKTDDDGNGLTGVTFSWDKATGSPRGYITVRKVGDPTTFVEFGITSDDTGGLTDYRAYSGSVTGSRGTFSNNDETMVSFRPSGRTPTAVYDQTISAAANNVDIGSASVARITPSGATRNLTGIVAKADGSVIRIINPSGSGQTLAIQNDNAGSTAANRFLMRSGGGLALAPGQAVTFVYCTTSQRWLEC